MGANVGNINLGLNVDYSGFNNQLTGIKKQAEGTLTNAFKGIGKVAAAAFSIAAITKFTKSCLDLGSSLSEVQNVVDVTFGSQGAKVIESFSKNAMASLGLSELKAKQYTSTLGAMYKSMGMTSDQALGMSIEMTKLAGDMASFYNLDADEAFQKIRSGVSGETEPLKQLGINMSVANLEAYAMTQGITKSFNKMSQAEQALLRYNYLLSVTSDAQGDFARTSDSWANQTKVLSLQFETLKSTLGKAFITILTPVIRLLNILMQKLVQAAALFESFISALFGKKQSALDATTSGAAAMGDSLQSASDASTGIGTGLEDSAKQAKKLNKQLAGFDELNVLNTKDDSDDSGSVGDSLGGGSDFNYDFDMDSGPLVDATVKVDALRGAFEKLLSITGLDVFFEKIKNGFNSVNWAGIGDNLKSIGSSLIPIAQALGEGLLTVLRSYLSYMGTLIGGLIGVVGDSLEILTGAIATFLNTQGPIISQWITDTAGKWAAGIDNMTATWESMFSLFRGALQTNSGAIQEMLVNLLTAVSNLGMTIQTIFADAFQIATEKVKDFVNNNQPLISNFFSSTMQLATQLGNFIAQVVGGIADVLSNFWNTYGKPIWAGVVSAITDVIGWVMQLWNNVLQPALSYLTSKISEVWSSSLQPFLANLASFFGEVGLFILDLWNFLKPFVQWIIDNIGPVVLVVCNYVADVIANVVSTITNIVNGIVTFFKGIIQFFRGVFTGDWSLAWEGIKNIFKGIWDSILAIFEGFVNSIQIALNFVANLFSTVWNAIKSVVVSIGTAIANFLSGLWEGITNVISMGWTGIATFFTNIWEAIKSVFSAAATQIGTILSNAWNAMSASITSIFTTIKDFFATVWEWIKTIFSTAASAISTVLSTVWTAISTAITTAWNNIKTFFSTIWAGIKYVFTAATTTISTALSTAWTAISTAITTAWNAIKTFFSTIWNGIKTTITTIVTAISTALTTAWNTIKNGVSTAFNAVKSTFSTIWNGIKSTISSIVNSISSTLTTAWNSIKNGVSTAFNSVKSTISSIWNGIKSSISSIVSSITSSLTTAFTNVKSKLSTIMDSIKTVFSNGFNALKSLIKTPVNAVIDAINSFIKALNKISVDVPDWVPGIGGGTFGFNIPTIPRLAQGGIVSAPMLAQVGDNPRSSEVVSPLHELLPMIAAAVAEAFKAQATTQSNQDLYLTLQVGSDKLVDTVIKGINRRTVREGTSPIIL